MFSPVAIREHRETNAADKRTACARPEERVPQYPRSFFPKGLFELQPFTYQQNVARDCSLCDGVLFRRKWRCYAYPAISLTLVVLGHFA